MKPIYDEEFSLSSFSHKEKLSDLQDGIRDFIRDMYVCGYDITQIQSEILNVVDATVCELKIMHGIQVRRSRREN